MTLNDIGRMLKLAKVPRSKVIQTTYPNAGFVVLVPMSHYFIIANVVGRLQFRTDNVAVKPISDERIADSEHQFVKVTGDDGRIKRDVRAETRQMYYQRRRLHNRNTVIESTSVVL